MNVQIRRRAILVGVVLALLVVVLANAHLVYVAMNSQPDCVAYVRPGAEDGSFGAAKPSC